MTGLRIFDGGGNMYDDGNILATNLLRMRPYSDRHRDAAATRSSAPAARYFTAKYPGLFVLAAQQTSSISRSHRRRPRRRRGRQRRRDGAVDRRRRPRRSRVFVKRVFGAARRRRSTTSSSCPATAASTHSFPPTPTTTTTRSTASPERGEIYYLLVARAERPAPRRRRRAGGRQRVPGRVAGTGSPTPTATGSATPAIRTSTTTASPTPPTTVRWSPIPARLTATATGSATRATSDSDNDGIPDANDPCPADPTQRLRATVRLCSGTFPAQAVPHQSRRRQRLRDRHDERRQQLYRVGARPDHRGAVRGRGQSARRSSSRSAPSIPTRRQSTLIGPIAGGVVDDLAFRSDGTLFVFHDAVVTQNAGTVNLATGAAIAAAADRHRRAGQRHRLRRDRSAAARQRVHGQPHRPGHRRGGADRQPELPARCRLLQSAADRRADRSRAGGALRRDVVRRLAAAVPGHRRSGHRRGDDARADRQHPRRRSPSICTAAMASSARASSATTATPSTATAARRQLRAGARRHGVLRRSVLQRRRGLQRRWPCGAGTPPCPGAASRAATVCVDPGCPRSPPPAAPAARSTLTVSRP